MTTDIRAGAGGRSFGALPMRFEANLGQSDPRVRFTSRGDQGSLFLAPTEAVLVISPDASRTRERRASTAVRLCLAGSNPAPLVEGEGELEGTTNYLVGNDPAQWRTKIPGFGAVRYRGVYPGIDIVYYGNQRQLEYDFVVAPGADPRAIALRVEGAERLELDGRGDLVLSTPAGVLTQRSPSLYQETGGVRQPVGGRYVLLGGGAVGFRVGSYDPTRPLVIDPVLTYSTYLGGSFSDTGWGIAVDRSGSAYVTGDTGSFDFPTVHPYDATPHGVFVTKLNPAGNALVYSTYIGGSGTETSRGIAVDDSGSVYVTGETTSSDFPTVHAYDSTHNGDRDAFILKLGETGDALVYSTFFGGGLSDRGNAIAIDADGAAYVAGTTYSDDLPTAGAYDDTFNGGSFDAFVTKLTEKGDALVYSTFLGGSSFDEGFGIALDESGAAYVTGYTWSGDFPTADPFDPTVGGADAYVTKLGRRGDALVYSTFLGGGSASEVGFDIAVDALGSAYVTGNTVSDDFPTQNAFDGTHSPGAADAFVTRLEPAGNALVYSTYLGGRAEDYGRAIVVDADGVACVTGYTGSGLDFPIVGAAGTYNGGEYDAFVTQVGPAGNTLEYSTFLGGSSADFGFGIAADRAGTVLVTGRTGSSNFPTLNPYDASLSAPFYDAFVAKMARSADLSITKTASAATVASGAQLTYTISILNAGPDAARDVVVHDATPVGTTFAAVSVSQGTCASPLAGGTGSIVCSVGAVAPASSSTVTIVLNVTAPPGAVISNVASVESSGLDQNAANNTATATTVVGEPCEILCPPPITVGTGPEAAWCGAIVGYGPPTTVGDCGTVSCTPASGSAFPVGTTTVLCATGAGNSCSFTVTVEDTTPPVIDCPSDLTVPTASPLEAAVDYTFPIVADNCAVAGVQCSPAPGSLFPIGETTVTCTAMDAAGNDSACTFKVSVVQAGPNGTDTVGVFVPSSSVWFLRNANTGGWADSSFSFGPGGAGFVPVRGDWDGDRNDTAGVYDPASGTFFLRNRNASGSAEMAFSFGPGGLGWIPLSGDWDGDGRDTVGVYDPATSVFYLKNSNSPGAADLTFSYGAAMGGYRPIAGDWDGDGRDSVGLYVPGTATFFLKNTNASGLADVAFSYGPPNVTPVTGDWNADGIDTIGVYLPATGAWFLRDLNSAGVATATLTYGPPNATPLAGNWDGL